MGCCSSNVDDDRGAVPTDVQHDLRKLGLDRMEILELYAYFCTLELTKDSKLDLDVFLIRMKLDGSKLTVKIFNSMDSEAVESKFSVPGKHKHKHKHKIAYKEFVMYALKFITMEQTEMAEFAFDLYVSTEHHNYLDGDRDDDCMKVGDLKHMITSIHGVDHTETLEALFRRMVGEEVACNYALTAGGNGSLAGTDAPDVESQPSGTTLPPQDQQQDPAATTTGTGHSNVVTMGEVAFVHAALRDQAPLVSEKKSIMDAIVTRVQFVEHIVEFPSLLYPIFLVQSTLRREILGEGFWEKLHPRALKAKETSDYLELFGALPHRRRGLELESELDQVAPAPQKAKPTGKASVAYLKQRMEMGMGGGGFVAVGAAASVTLENPDAGGARMGTHSHSHSLAESGSDAVSPGHSPINSTHSPRGRSLSPGHSPRGPVLIPGHSRAHTPERTHRYAGGRRRSRADTVENAPSADSSNAGTGKRRPACDSVGDSAGLNHTGRSPRVDRHHSPVGGGHNAYHPMIARSNVDGNESHPWG